MDNRRWFTVEHGLPKDVAERLAAHYAEREINYDTRLVNDRIGYRVQAIKARYL